jgi:hypothetical protein
VDHGIPHALVVRAPDSPLNVGLTARVLEDLIGLEMQKCGSDMDGGARMQREGERGVVVAWPCVGRAWMRKGGLVWSGTDIHKCMQIVEWGTHFMGSRGPVQEGPASCILQLGGNQSGSHNSFLSETLPSAVSHFNIEKNEHSGIQYLHIY